MLVLSGGIVFGILFVIYMAWIYVQSCVFMTKGFVNDENEIKDVTMKQFFHFGYAGEIDDKRKI